MNRNDGQREMVYCHQCENEWYRDEHGLVCPDCQSDFTEVIEAGNDPRNNGMPQPEEAVPPRTGTHEFYAPDPEEDDIEHFHERHRGTGQHEGWFANEHGRETQYGGAHDRQPGGQDQAGGLLGLVGSLFGGAGQRQGPQQRQQEGFWGQHPPQHQEQNQYGQRPQQQEHEHFRTMTNTPGGHTVVRHTSGPNFSMTFTTTTNSNLRPRDANNPQAFQHQPDHIEQLLGRIMMNIGAMHGQPGFVGGGARLGQQGPIFMEFGGGGRGAGGPAGGALPFNDLLSLFMPPGGVHGDAVYSQDALDRIITQMMEQHRSGNAPGPATEEAIASLPSRAITKADQSDTGKAECSICMDEAPLGDEVTVLPCDHWFHFECIKAWLSEHDTCPHCRRGIMAKDEPNTNRPRQPSQTPLNDAHSPQYQIPRTPGEFPFARQDSAGSSRPGGSAAPRSPGASGSGSGSNIFNRMREVFGNGGGSSSSGGGGSGGGQAGSRQQ